MRTITHTHDAEPVAILETTADGVIVSLASSQDGTPLRIAAGPTRAIAKVKAVEAVRRLHTLVGAL
jgi:hypothetical protein